MTRSRLSFTRRSIDEPTVNLTPLIDVVFVILIMFIVVAPLLELDKVELAEGPSSSLASSSVQETSPISIHVHHDNSLWLNNEQISLGDFPQKLRQAKFNHPKANPQVFLDKKAHFGTYQTIKNSAEEAGYHSLDIILKPT